MRLFYAQLTPKVVAAKNRLDRTSFQPAIINPVINNGIKC